MGQDRGQRDGSPTNGVLGSSKGASKGDGRSGAEHSPPSSLPSHGGREAKKPRRFKGLRACKFPDELGGLRAPPSPSLKGNHHKLAAARLDQLGVLGDLVGAGIPSHSPIFDGSAGMRLPKGGKRRARSDIYGQLSALPERQVVNQDVNTTHVRGGDVRSGRGAGI